MGARVRISVGVGRTNLNWTPPVPDQLNKKTGPTQVARLGPFASKERSEKAEKDDRTALPRQPEV